MVDAPLKWRRAEYDLMDHYPMRHGLGGVAPLGGSETKARTRTRTRTAPRFAAMATMATARVPSVGDTSGDTSVDTSSSTTSTSKDPPWHLADDPDMLRAGITRGVVAQRFAPTATTTTPPAPGLGCWGSLNCNSSGCGNPKTGAPCGKDGKAGAADEAAAKLDAGALANQKFEMLRAKADAADKVRALREEKEKEEKAAREKAANAKWVAERAERAANLTDQVECDFTPPPPFVYAKKPGVTCGEVGSFLLIPECDDTTCCASMAECEERGKMVRGGETWAETHHSIYMVLSRCIRY